MASKVLVPTAPFAKLQVKTKTPPEQSGSGFHISSDPNARVAHLEHSVRFLQDQHRLMLSGLHAEIEALRERNRDLQFQLIFNKESSPKPSPALAEETPESSEEGRLQREVVRLEREAAAARGEARAAEARALQLQRLLDAQAEKIRELECVAQAEGPPPAEGVGAEAYEESRAELRARLADAERLVRRLRTDAERQRRELQCMKNSLHASLRATGLDGYGYQNNYHFPPLAEFWQARDEYGGGRGGGVSRGARRPLTLPELAGQQIRSTVYANNHTRPRANYEHKGRKSVQAGNDVAAAAKSPDEPQEHNRLSRSPQSHGEPPRMFNIFTSYPELKKVVTKMLPETPVGSSQGSEGGRVRARRPHHRKHAPDHT